MKKVFAFLLASLALMVSSCELSDFVEENPEVIAHQPVDRTTVLTATMADPTTKTTLAEDGDYMKVLWAYQDKLTVFYKGIETLSKNGAGVSNGFVAEGAANEYPKETASFSGTLPAGDNTWDDPYQVYAIYPYRASGNYISRINNVTTIQPQLNSTQGSAVAGATSDGIMVHVGRATDASVPVKFYNMCSLLRFKVSNPDVRRVVLSSDEVICGGFSVVFDGNGIPSITEKLGDDSKKKISLYKADNSAFETNEWYYIALLPTTFTNGATLTVYTSDGTLMRQLKSEVSFERNRCKSVGTLDEGKTYEISLSPKMSLYDKTVTKTTLWPNGTAALSASLSNTSGVDVAGNWVWSSSDESVATVTNGVVTPVWDGAEDKTTDITATTVYKGVEYTALCTVTVTTANHMGGHEKSFTVGVSNNVAQKVYFAPGNLRLTYGLSAEDSTYSFNLYQGQNISNKNYWPYHTANTSRDLLQWYEVATRTEQGEDIPIIRELNNNRWQVLTVSQWTYLLNTRTASTINGKSNARYAKAIINGVPGILLFPDTYSHPSNVTAIEKNSINVVNKDFSINVYYGSSWEKMEKAGVVFLPANNLRNSNLNSPWRQGEYYWTSTTRSTNLNNGHWVNFTGTEVSLTSTDKTWFLSVRLVRFE